MPAATSRAWLPGRGIVYDVRGRLPHYRDDWLQGCNWGVKVFAPATYIFFASALPALAFGQQLAVDTAGTLTVVHVLISTALAGLVQSIIGGQPLLIIGVAEPIVLIYGFLYSYCSSNADLGSVLFLPWCAWVCIWTAVMCLLLALLNACDGINRFTRFSGELFGALIAILFLQVGIKGLVHEFQPAAAAQTGSSSPTASSSSSSNLLLINGLWGLLLAFGLLLTSLKILTARRWLLGRSWLRGLLADYGVPLLVVVWTAASFAVRPEHDVPRRVQTPNTWEVYDNWSVARRLSDVPGPYIAAALLPAIVITILFYFDHNVSSQMAQQPEFDLKKPAAYHYDFLLLAALTLICGLLGLPPVNGVLPQAPMHSRSLAHIRKHRNCKQQQQQQQQCVSLEMLQQPPTARSSAAATPSNAGTDIGSNAADVTTNAAAAAPGQMRLTHEYPARHHTAVQITTTSLEIPDSPGSTRWQQQQQQQGVGGTAELRHRHHSPHSHQQQQQQQQQFNDTQQQQQQRKGTKPLKEIDSEVQLNMLPDSAADGRVLLADNTGSSSSEQQQQHTGHYLQLEVREQRVTNLLQSLLVCLCLGITPAIKLIPTAVLWGYFIFMAADSLTGSQLWDRTLLLITDPKKRIRVMQQEHAAYLQLVPYRVIVSFTLLQLSYLLAVWALTTWAGVAAVTFPLPIMALVPVRQYLLPLLFKQQHLAQLDAASYEAAAAVTDPVQAQQELVAVGAIAGAPEDQLPIAANGSAAAAAGVDDHDDLSPTAAAAAAVNEDEGELLDHEFVRYQLKHHLDPSELNRHRQA